MLHRFLTAPASVALASILLAANAYAIPIDFSIAGADAEVSNISVGTTVSVTPSSGLAHNFMLDLDGASSHTFDFLDVTASGIGGATGLIEATLHFTSPKVTSAEGVLGDFAVILGLVSGGGVSVISNPAPIAFDGGWFAVTFQGFTASCVFCTSISGTVSATVSLLSGPSTSVSEPATLMLLGAGFIALGLSRRRPRR